MKRLLSTLAVVMLFILTATGQVPKSFKYQTVLRNSQGQVLANQQVDLTLEILRGTVLGPVVCSETYTPTTNEY